MGERTLAGRSLDELKIEATELMGTGLGSGLIKTQKPELFVISNCR